MTYFSFNIKKSQQTVYFIEEIKIEQNEPLLTHNGDMSRELMIENPLARTSDYANALERPPQA